jgi:predicted AAA+ superfamily ATPase
LWTDQSADELNGHSTNARKEISKAAKWYFYDNGIRNAIINDFKLPALRNDLGALWENYLLSERIKMNDYQANNIQYYFWRNYDQQEVDLIELKSGQMRGYEFKYSPDKKIKAPVAFSAIYPNASFSRISKDNYLSLIVQE